MWIKRVVSFALIASMICTSEKIEAFAEEPEDIVETLSENVKEDDEYLNVNSEENETIVSEIISSRDEYSKEYLLSNGARALVVYAQPVHYVAENGAMLEIDNSLRATEEGYENVDNKYHVLFTDSENSKGKVFFESDDYKINWEYVDVPENEENNHTDLRVEKEDGEEKLDDLATFGHVIGSSNISFEGYADGTKLEYEPLSDGVKESIIVDNRDIGNKFSFKINLNGLKARINLVNEVELYDEESGEIKYIFPAPFMVDANGDYSDAVWYSFGNKKETKDVEEIPQDEKLEDEEVRDSKQVNCDEEIKKTEEVNETEDEKKSEEDTEIKNSKDIGASEVDEDNVKEEITENEQNKGDITDKASEEEFEGNSENEIKVQEDESDSDSEKDSDKALEKNKEEKLEESSETVDDSQLGTRELDEENEEIEENEDCIYLTITADDEWLSSASFPVVIDPIIKPVVDMKNVDTCCVNSTSAFLSDTLLAGKSAKDNCVYRSFVKFDLPKLKENKIISSAELNVTSKSIEAPGKDGCDYLVIKKITSPWQFKDTEEKTISSWETQPTFDNRNIDYIKTGHKFFDITKAVREWYEEISPNYGLAIMSYDEARNGLGTLSLSTAKTTPYLKITYRDSVGIEEYWGTHKTAVGTAGEGYINDYTGALTVINNDVTTNGLRKNINIQHVYNSNEDGHKWKLNYEERITVPLDELDITAYPYVYTDGDGTKHYFKAENVKYFQNGAEYTAQKNNLYPSARDEDGLKLYIVQVTDPVLKAKYPIKLIDKSASNVKYFDKYGRLALITDSNRYENGKAPKGKTVNEANTVEIIYEDSDISYSKENYDLVISSAQKLNDYSKKTNFEESDYIERKEQIGILTSALDALSTDIYAQSDIRVAKCVAGAQNIYNSMVDIYSVNNSVLQKSTKDIISKITEAKKIIGDTVLYEGYISQVKDAVGRVSTIEYDSAKRIVSISDPSKVDKKNRYIYTENGLLAEVVFANNKSAKYEYSEDGKLISMQDNSGYEVRYSYSGNHVCKVQECANKVEGQTYTIEYGVNNINKFRFSGIDDVFGNVDDVINTYVFDAQGRKISEYSNFVGKREVLGAQAYTYADNIGKNIARTTYNDQTNSKVTNYLVNAGFEDGLGSWTILKDCDWNVGSTSSTHYFGERCGTLSPKGSLVGFYQEVRLPKGTYVISYRTKRDGDSNLGVCIDFNGELKEITQYAVKDDEWSFQYGSFTIDEESTIPVCVMAEGNGTSYIDGMVLEAGTKPSGYVSSVSTGEKKAADKDESNTRHKIKDYAVKGRQTVNYLKNHDFEFKESETGTDAAWITYVGEKKAAANQVNKYAAVKGKDNTNISYVGARATVFTMANLKASTAGIKQEVKSLKAGTYTLSGFVKADNIVDTKIWLRVTDNNGNNYKSEILDQSSTKRINEGWKRLTVTFDIEDKSDIEIAAEVEGGANTGNGKVYLDSLQLETGDIANQYNILEDGSFDLAINNSLYKWDSYKKGTFNDEIISSGVDGGKCYHITGEPGRNKYLKFTTELSYTTESYILSGWIKTNTTPVRKGRELKVKAYHSDDNSVFESTLGLDDYSDGWKYFTLVLPSHKWKKTDIAILFYDNIGDLYIDDLQLSKNDVCTNEYNTNGTKKALNQGKKSTQNTYDGYNRVSSIKSPSGSTQNIKYDEYNHVSVVTSNSEAGKSNTVMTYDKYGNQLTLEEQTVEDPGVKSTALYASNTYTEDGNYLKSTTGNNGATKYYTYDENTGLKTSETIPTFEGKAAPIIKYNYDDYGNLKKVVRSSDNNSRQINYIYGDFSDLKSIEHNGFNYEYEYDSFGNIISTSIAGQVTQKNVYNPFNGSLKETQFADNSIQYSEYDEYGNVKEIYSKIDGEEHPTDSYKYYNDGNVAIHKDEINSISTEYDYNNSNDIVRTKVKGKINGIDYSSATQFTYNTAGNVEEASYFLNDKEQNYKYTYHLDGKPNVSTLPSGSIKSNTYDKLRRLTKENYKLANNANNLVVNYKYADGVSSKNSIKGTQNKISKYTNTIGKKTQSDFSYEYDSCGNITSIDSIYSIRGVKGENYYTSSRYKYNEFGEISKAVETHIIKGRRECSYEYDAGGNIISEKVVEDKKPTITHNYKYDSVWRDKLISYDGHPIEYDLMGHPTKYLGLDMRWNGINDTLEKISGDGKNISYKYLSDGTRLSKKVGKNTTTYIYNAGKLLAEETDVDRINYYYDSEDTIVEIGYQKKSAGKLSAECRYFYTKNAQGDVVGICRSSDSVPVGTYEYDIWGNVIAIEASRFYKGEDENNILERNPIRYRGYYYDNETKFYYLNARYYDPKVHRFISADSVIAGVSEDVNGYNLFEYSNNNPVNCQDQSGNFPELSNTQKVAIGLGIITVLAVSAVVTGGASCVVMGALIGSCTGAVSGAASGAVISGGIEYLKTRDMQATKQAAIDGAADGFMWGSVTGAVTGGMTSPYCFVAGTLVCTVDGEVPIEDIEVGDYVLAENPDTGEVDYKPVLETYEHDTYDVVYLTIDGEEFTTTEGHPFYTLERGFVKAGELRFSDTLIDDNGNKLHLEKKNKEHLTKPVTVYNFAVEDYHTYFVGENEVLVHNNCGVNPENGFSSFSKFKRVFGKAGEGKEWHHIVEQSQIGKSGFDPKMIHNMDNMIALDRNMHRRVTAIYNSVLNDTEGMTLRNWLAGQSFEVQYRRGIEVLKSIGAL